MLRIRHMHPADIPFAIRLSDQEHWGVTRSDLERLLRLTPKGCFIAFDGAKRLGLTTSTVYGQQLAWIGNVIVDKEYRGKHIGRQLVEHTVTFLRSAGIRHTALYCFNKNVRFYENMGFIKDKQFVRMRRKGRAIRTDNPILKRGPPLKRLLKLDQNAFGADRARLLREVLRNKAGWYLASSFDDDSISYLLIRRYHDMSEIGPWVGNKVQEDDIEQMLRTALGKVGKLPIEVSCLKENRVALNFMKRYRFGILREGYRMFYGKRARLGNDDAQYALGFLDKG